MRKMIYVVLKENLQTGVSNIFVTIHTKRHLCLNYIRRQNFLEGDKFRYYYEEYSMVV